MPIHASFVGVLGINRGNGKLLV